MSEKVDAILASGCLEKLLEEIGGNSKGHHLITGDQDKLNIFKQVCKDLKINPEWTGLNF